MAMTAHDWLDGYKAAWENRDPEAAAALFTPEALYREQPYQEPFHGQDGVRNYWTEVTSTQSDVNFRYGTPIVTDDRTIVEWWVTMQGGGADITLAGVFLLRFAADGRCSELIEYWHFGEGQLQPYPHWGR